MADQEPLKPKAKRGSRARKGIALAMGIDQAKRNPDSLPPDYPVAQFLGDFERLLNLTAMSETQLEQECSEADLEMLKRLRSLKGARMTEPERQHKWDGPRKSKDVKPN